MAISGVSSPLHSESGLLVGETKQLSGRSRLGRLTGIEIASTGSYVPETIVANSDLAALGCDSDWIVQRTGIQERRRADPEQATSDLALQAAERCLARGKTSAAEIDLIVVATMTPDHATPSTACHLQRHLGCVAPAMDVNAACAGFMYALVTACHFVSAGTARCALVVGSEVMSRTVNPLDKRTMPLFGDGAGAVLLRPTAERSKGLLSYTLGAEGCGGQMLCVPGGGSRSLLSAQTLADGDHYLRMDGRAVFKWAVRVISDSARDCLAHANLTMRDMDLIVPHQANLRIIEAAMADFGVDRDRIFVNVERYGNTSAASIPLALDEALSAGRIRPGNKVLLCGFGAGLAWGAAIVQV